MVALYGCGALICREVAHRFGLGFPGLVLLGVAYGVWEEGLVDRYWFLVSFWDDSGVGTYSVVAHTNILLAAHLTAFHTAISICSSVMVVEWLAPGSRHRPWVGRRGLVLAGVTLALTPLIYGEFDQRPPAVVLVSTTALLIAVVVAAFLVGRRAGAPASPSSTTADGPRRGLGLLAFACVLGHWIATYSVPESGLPWPAGLGLALLPVGIGLLLIPRLARTGPWGSDGIRVVVGLLSFFVLLDILVGVLGRYDMFISALVTAWVARRMYKRREELGAPTSVQG